MFQIYICDTETSGLVVGTHEVIEVSFFHLNQNRQMSWFLKPNKPETIEKDALRINGTNIDDLLHKTAEGRAKYRDPKLVISEIENWINEDFDTPDKRLLVGQNINFDKMHLEELWKSCDAIGTFPFGRRYLDTLQIELLLDIVEEKDKEFYNLSGLVEFYKVKKEKSHRADSDTRMTKDVLLKQFERMKARLIK